MKGLLIVSLLFCLAAADFCSDATDCVTCQARADAKGNQCSWCTTNDYTMGCFAQDASGNACPSQGRATGQSSCPVSVDSCLSATTCSDCLARAGPDTQYGSGSCSWCQDYQNHNIGCRPSNQCPSNSAEFQYSCPSGNSQQAWGVGVSSVAMCVGIVLGLIGLLHSLGKKEEDQARAAIVLWAISLLVWGAAFFSAGLSYRVLNARRRSRGCCSCGCTWIHILAVFEMLGVLAGFLTGVIIDASLMDSYSSYTWYQPSFTFIIGLPVAVSSILCFGLPRVLITRSLSRKASYQRLEDDARERSPLVHQQQQQQQHHHHSTNTSAESVPPVYYTPHPAVQYAGSPPVAAPAGQPPAYNYQVPPPAGEK